MADGLLVLHHEDGFAGAVGGHGGRGARDGRRHHIVHARQVDGKRAASAGFARYLDVSAALLDSSSTVCDAKWRQLVDSTQGDASRREILVSRHFSQIAANRYCYRSEERGLGK